MFIILEIYDTYNTTNEVQLSKISQKIGIHIYENGICSKRYTFKLPTNTKNTEKNVGHFTAASFQNNQWLKYDDLRNQPKKLPILLITKQMHKLLYHLKDRQHILYFYKCISKTKNS